MDKLDNDFKQPGFVPVTNSTAKRIRELDALRGLTALSVVLYHYTLRYDQLFDSVSPSKFYFRYGDLGVPLFFMISGFVILMTLDNTANYRQFLISRFSRLYPVYWFCIGMTVGLCSLLDAPLDLVTYSWKQILINVTMLQRFIGIEDVDKTYWTLAIELVFYFWAALLFYNIPRRLIPFVCLSWLLLSAFSSLDLLPYKTILNQVFILRFAGFFAGGLCFYLIRVDGSSRLLTVLLISSFIVNILAIRSTPFSIGLIAYAAFYAIFYLIINNQLLFLTSRWFLFVGSISYPLYLSHESIGWSIIYYLRQLYDHQWFYVSIPTLIMIGVAYLIHYYVEKPAMRYIRGRFIASKRPYVSSESGLVNVGQS